MKLSTLFQKDHVFIDHQVQNTGQLFVFASRIMSESTGVDASSIEAALLHRESLGGTVLGKETMVPHAYVEGLKDYIIMYVRLKSPLLLDGGNTVRHAFIILTSREMAAFHLKIMRAVADILTNHDQILLSAGSAESFISELEKTGVRVESHLHARDFLQSVPSIRETDSVSRAVDLMKEQNWSHVPVTDVNGRFVGTVDFIDVLGATMPDYVMRLSDLSFLEDFEPLKQFALKENSMSVRAYIKNISTMIVTDDVSYVEVLFLMVKHRHRFLIAVDQKGLFLGVIRSMDVINRIFRA